MTTTVADVRSTRLRVAVSADLLAVAGLFILAAGLAALTWGTWGDLGRDTGYDIAAGARTAGGELPYVDYVYYYGPLAPALLGLFGFLFGVGTGYAVALGLILAAAVVFATYVLARTLAGPLGAFLAGAIVAPVAFAPSIFSFVLPHTFSATLGLLATFIFLIGLARYANESDRGWLIVAGVGAGLVALTRPEFEFAVIAALGAWLVLRARAGLGGIREAATVLTPAVLIPAAVYGAFLLAVPPDRLLFENLYPVEALESAGNAVLSIHAPLTAGSFVDLAQKMALYAAGVAAMIGCARLLSAEGRGRRVLLAAVLLGGAVVLAGSIANPEALRRGLQFAYGWIPAGAVIAIVVLLWRFRRRDALAWTPAAQTEFAVSIVLAVLAVKTYAAFFPHSPRAQPAVYAIPLAAVFLARLHLVALARRRAAYVLGALWLAFLGASGAGLVLKDASAEAHVVRGPGGTLKAAAAEATVFNAALAWIEDETSEGDAVLLAPQLTALYVLADRTNPLPQISLLPGALADDREERTAIGRLEKAGVRLAVIDRHSYDAYGHTTFGDSFGRTLAGWVRRNFNHVATLRAAGDGTHTLDVWLRRNP